LAFAGRDNDVEVGPLAWAAGLPVVIDEIQRLPQITLALKRIVDRDRRPGQFVLTGSSNVFTTPKALDGLAGRVSTLILRPLSTAELQRRVPCGLLDAVRDDRTDLLGMLPPPLPFGWADAIDLIVRDGFPEIRPLSDAARMARGTAARLGSGRYRHWRERIVGWLEPLSEVGTERAIVNGAANLQQEIGTSSRPAHLLELVHSPIDQEVRRAFGDESANTQAAAIPLGVIDEPATLTAEIGVDLVQRVPQVARWHTRRAMAEFAPEDMHDLADPVDAALGIPCLVFPNAPAQALDLLDNYHLRRHPCRIVGRKGAVDLLRVL
jgi:hypothetical protein